MANLYRLTNFPAPLDEDAASLCRRVAEAAGVKASELAEVQVVKRSVDARKKPRIRFVLQVEFRAARALAPPPRGVEAIERSALDIPEPGFLSRARPSPERVVVVGAGPAGLFAGLALAESGRRVVLLERGKEVGARMRDIGALRASGRLDPESNVCFGEGGAGAYTDGKLYTRIKHPFARWVMKTFIEAGADRSILVDAHPHLGTDKLVEIVKRIRERMLAAGAEVRFQSRVESLLLKDGAVRGVRLAAGEELPAAQVVLAIGHSARDTIEALYRAGVRIEPKGFAVGVRAEHPQELVDMSQYGAARHAALGAAAYALTHQVPDKRLKTRGVYSFCMCPGGFIVPSPTEPERMAVNGMSNSNRSTRFGNSGVVVQVDAADLVGRGFPDTPLAGVAFQRELEAAAFKAAGRPYWAPAIRIDDFLAKRSSAKLAATNFRPGAEPCDLDAILPDWVAGPLREGIRAFARKIKGYDSAEGNLFAVESRTSAPIRMTRGVDRAAVGIKGLYPAGEGAGYAGGIVSAAVDGLRAAEAVLGGEMS